MNFPLSPKAFYHQITQRRNAVTDVMADREAEVLQLADVELERRQLPVERGSEVPGTGAGPRRDRVERGLCPRAIRPPRIEPSQAAWVPHRRQVMPPGSTLFTTLVFGPLPEATFHPHSVQPRQSAR